MSALPTPKHTLEHRYHKELGGITDDRIKALCTLAFICGWKRTGNKGIHLVSPDGGKKQITLSDGDELNADRYRQYCRTILTYRDRNDHTPTRVLVQQILDDGFKLDPSSEWFLSKAGEIPTERTVEEPMEIPAEAEEKLSPVASEHMGESKKSKARRLTAVPEPEEQPVPDKKSKQPPMVVGPAVGERHVVSISPWITASGK